MDRRRIALDTAIVFGFSLFLIGFSIFFYVMFLSPSRGFFTICGQGINTSCWANLVGPIFMFSALYGGALLFFVGAFRRKTTKLTLWESVLVGSIVGLFFDLVVLPEGAFLLLPFNSGGMPIFVLFVMSLIGIIFSAFKYIQTGDGGTSETRLKRPILTTPKIRKKVYALILVAGLIIATALFLAPSIIYGGGFIYGCPPEVGQLSFKISNYTQLVGPPLFSQEQFVITPGTTTYVTFIWNATSNGNNAINWFTGTPPITGFNYTYLPRINSLTGEFDGLPTQQDGVIDEFQNITFQGTYIARILYKISLSPIATPATYELVYSCDYHLLMTVGSLPYWGPLFYGVVQPMELIFNVAISLVGSSLLITILKIHYSDPKKVDIEPTPD
jgi:hypothetical protein